jgi:hypothetical protein
MLNKPFYSNLIYCIGYPILIWHNMVIGDPTQMNYFILLEIISIIGVIYYIYSCKYKVICDCNDNSK